MGTFVFGCSSTHMQVNTHACKQIEHNFFVIYFLILLLINTLCVVDSSVDFSSDILCVWQSEVDCFEEPAVLCG